MAILFGHPALGDGAGAGAGFGVGDGAGAGLGVVPGGSPGLAQPKAPAVSDTAITNTITK